MAIEDRRLIRSASTKYDGSIHYEFDTYLIDHVDGCLRLWIPAGTPNNGYRGPGVFERDALAVFFPDDPRRGFNVFLHQQPYPGLDMVMASDMLMNAHLDGDTLRWIDLDLDVEVFADGRIELVDEDEFAEHQLRYDYPPEVIAAAEASAELALELARTASFPFNREQQFSEVLPILARS